jgi:hypothetical protein
MRTVRQWWGELNGIKKSLITAGTIFICGGSGALAVQPYLGIPEQVEGHHLQIDTLQRDLSNLKVEFRQAYDKQNAKLDRVICLLTIEPSESPLHCEE